MCTTGTSTSQDSITRLATIIHTNHLIEGTKYGSKACKLNKTKIHDIELFGFYKFIIKPLRVRKAGASSLVVGVVGVVVIVAVYPTI